MSLTIASEDIERYALAHTTPDSDHLAAVSQHTREHMPMSQMLAGATVGQLLAMLIHATAARQVLEIGTYTGYSTLSMAEAADPACRITTLEYDGDTAAVAQQNFDAHPRGSMIDLRVGPALESIAALDGPFDLVFVDADKTEYQDYVAAVLPRLAAHGVIAVDNTLWSGRVADPDEIAADADTAAIAAFNDAMVADDRLACVLLTVRDGVTLIRRRA